MKLFLDTAQSESIKKYAFLLDGVTTNPSHLYKEGGNPKEVIATICGLLPNKPISVEITEKEPNAVYKQARALAALHKNIVVKVPCHADYYPTIARLVAEGIPVNVTLVFTLVQALYMCKLGATYISPFVGRWDDIDVPGAELLYELRAMIDQYHYETKIIAASLRSVRHLNDAIQAGADIATVPPALLEQSMEHVLTNQGIAKFDADWQKLGIKQFP